MSKHKPTEIQNLLNVAINKYYNTINAAQHHAIHTNPKNPSFQKRIDDINTAFATSTIAAFEAVTRVLKLLHETEVETSAAASMPVVKTAQLRIPYWIRRNDTNTGIELIVDAEIDLSYINALDIRPNQYGISSYLVPRCKNSLLHKKCSNTPSGEIIINDVPLDDEAFLKSCLDSPQIIPSTPDTGTDDEFLFYFGIYKSTENTFIVSHRLYPRPNFPNRTMTLIDPLQGTEGFLRCRLPRGLFDYVQPIATEGTFHVGV